MQKILSLLFLLTALASVQAADKKSDAKEHEWLSDLPTAQAKAKAENKLVLMDFTGSDWCSWCIKLHKEVFSTPEFKEYAKDKLVLMEVDFPQTKKQTKALKKANEALQEKYKIEGFPTIVVLDGEGKKVGELGYMPGGPKAFLAALDKLNKK
jgi:thioredoxin-related protein